MTSLFNDCSYRSDTTDSHLTLLFDKNFNPISKQEENLCNYILSATILSDDTGLITCQFSVLTTTSEEIIYELQTSLFPTKETCHD